MILPASHGVNHTLAEMGIARRVKATRRWYEIPSKYGAINRNETSGENRGAGGQGFEAASDRWLPLGGCGLLASMNSKTSGRMFSRQLRPAKMP
jgi:hypothetical protein